ncbi:MAG: glycerol-3-phosphate responsive antiterminator, GlpP [Firmicutes bacterium]|nr:glycerol-3-phosphate responsive antiterminator, GlpP [Bacillota bacterium]
MIKKMPWLCSGHAIPACRTEADFACALRLPQAPSLIILFGDINSLPDLLRRAEAAGKLLLVHLDLLDGVGRDRAGIVFLAKLGLRGLLTTKPQLGKIAQQEGMRVIQRMFLLDSESLRTGIHMLKGFRPDAIEALPASTPASVLAELKAATDVPILAGGLVRSQQDLEQAVANGAFAVSTSQRQLWNL